MKIPLYLDITKGGIIDEYKSVLHYFYSMGLLNAKGSYFNFNALFEVLSTLNVPYLQSFINTYGNSYRWKDLEEGIGSDRLLYGYLRLSVMDIIGSTYKLQKEVMKDYYNQIKQELISYGVVFEVLDNTENQLIETQEEVNSDVQ